MDQSKSLAVVTPGSQYKNLSLEQAKELAGAMVNAKMFPDLESANTAYVKILAGQEMGVPPFQAMNGIHIIKGRATIASSLLASKIMESGRYKYEVIVLDDTVCVLHFYELVVGKWVKRGESRFSAEDATRAGTQNMGRFPRNMLFARALSNGYKWYAPDALNGVTAYVEGEVLDDTPAAKSPEEEERELKEAAERLSKTRSKAANAGQKGLKPKPDAPEAAEAPASPEPPKDTPPTPEARETAPSEPQVAAATVAPPAPVESAAAQTRPTGQVDGDPATYMNPATGLEEPFASEEPAEESPHTDTQRKRIMATLNELGFKGDMEKRQVVAGILGLDTIVSFKTVTYGQAERLIAGLDSAGGAGTIMREMFVKGGPADATTATT